MQSLWLFIDDRDLGPSMLEIEARSNEHAMSITVELMERSPQVRSIAVYSPGSRRFTLQVRSGALAPAGDIEAF
jgi:hypothetical protein